MTKPPTLHEAKKRGLYAANGTGIHTFSNGSEFEGWADENCWECRYYSEDCAGEHCAFEGAALLGSVSPELARLFGWIESAEYPGEFEAPESCAFFREKQDDDGNDIPVEPDPDPTQLVLFGDPTEDAAIFALGTVAVEVPAHV